MLKQRIRNLVQPEMGLGHSDVHGKEGRREGMAGTAGTARTGEGAEGGVG